jgi:hypothetical protein
MNTVTALETSTVCVGNHNIYMTCNVLKAASMQEFLKSLADLTA